MNTQTNQWRQCAGGRLNWRAQVALRLFFAVVAGRAASGPAATAGPVPVPPGEFQPRLTISTYQPATTRDPFIQPGTSGAPARNLATDPTLFHIDGLFGTTKKMTAIINGSAVSLNKSVVLDTASGRISVKAVTITSEGVVLEVGGQHVELKRVTDDQARKPPK